MIAIRDGKVPSVGLRPAYRRLIPFGYQVVYSVEHHPQPSGEPRRFRHASFSVQDTRSGEPPVKGGMIQMPNPAAVEELISHLGFTRPMDECLLRIEDGYAINVLEPL